MDGTIPLSATARRVGELKGGTRGGKNVYTGFVDHLHPGGGKSETAATSVAFEVIERLTDLDGNRLLFSQIEVDTDWTNIRLCLGKGLWMGSTVRHVIKVCEHRPAYAPTNLIRCFLLRQGYGGPVGGHSRATPMLLPPDLRDWLPEDHPSPVRWRGTAP